MSEERAALIARRERLVARAAGERDELARQVGDWRRRLSGVERFVTVLGEVRRRAPAIRTMASVGLALLLVLTPMGATRWVRGGLAAWALARSVRRMLKTLRGG